MWTGPNDPWYRRTAMNRRPKDMTPEELAALPTGPWIQMRRPMTERDFQLGLPGPDVPEVCCPPVAPPSHRESDLLTWEDPDGRLWSFGRWLDGQWFKVPFANTAPDHSGKPITAH
jgi:hypothetical protein